MDTICLDGKTLAQKVKNSIREEIAANGYQPGLAVVLVGDDPSSNLYVSNKEKACRSVGINSLIIRKTSQCTEQELYDTIVRLNCDPSINGIIVQLPLPQHINTFEILSAISPDKDVDCLTPYRFGELFYSGSFIYPCTPSGIIEIFHDYKIPLAGKRCAVIGRSNIVGKPMAAMLLQENATVTLCHRFTKELPLICKESDIIISATGRRHMVSREMMKDGVILIDAGMVKGDDGKFYGDIDDGTGIASYATPVPGGVGPMTVAMLLKNTLSLYKRRCC